jgi:hypothetical protein
MRFRTKQIGEEILSLLLQFALVTVLPPRRAAPFRVTCAKRIWESDSVVRMPTIFTKLLEISACPTLKYYLINRSFKVCFFKEQIVEITFQVKQIFELIAIVFCWNVMHVNPTKRKKLPRSYCLSFATLYIWLFFLNVQVHWRKLTFCTRDYWCYVKITWN